MIPTLAKLSRYSVLPIKPFQVNRIPPVKPAKLDLKLKTMKDSYIEQFLLFKSDPLTRELYINFAGNIRIAKILENLDALAGAISYQHADDHALFKNQDSQITIVTASVDRIDLIRMPTVEMDMKIYGNVTFVGQSSMEVTMTCSQLRYKSGHRNGLETVLGNTSNLAENQLPIHSAASPELLELLKRTFFGKQNEQVKSLNSNIEEEIPVMTAKFCMVARDAYTQKAVQVHPLKIENTKEQIVFNRGAETRNLKKQQVQESLLKQPPSAVELKTVHNLFLKTQLSEGVLHTTSQPNSLLLSTKTKFEKSPGLILMSDTAQENISIMQPQDRNIHNFIFGGYLLRKAYELAYCTSMIFTGQDNVEFMAMDDVVFRKPVPIGSILKLRSLVSYSPQPSERDTLDEKWKDAFQVQVVADIIIKNQLETSNIFHFTFRPFHQPTEIRYVVPQTYRESLLYILGKRTFENGIKADI
eukprot:NODE_130_length_16779_cov_1.687410.p2 type:complete len:472 gc:universal NODE_130_length_16779_cov_1.687410:8684-7269(-)